MGTENWNLRDENVGTYPYSRDSLLRYIKLEFSNYPDYRFMKYMINHYMVMDGNTVIVNNICHSWIHKRGYYIEKFNKRCHSVGQVDAYRSIKCVCSLAPCYFEFCFK